MNVVMSPKQLKRFKEEMQNHVADTIRSTVNGKIEKIDARLENYIASDEAWKTRAEPVVRAFENTSWLMKLMVGLLKVGSLFGAAYAGWVIFRNFLIK